MFLPPLNDYLIRASLGKGYLELHDKDRDWWRKLHMSGNVMQGFPGESGDLSLYDIFHLGLFTWYKDQVLPLSGKEVEDELTVSPNRYNCLMLINWMKNYLSEEDWVRDFHSSVEGWVQGAPIGSGSQAVSFKDFLKEDASRKEAYEKGRDRVPAGKDPPREGGPSKGF